MINLKNSKIIMDLSKQVHLPESILEIESLAIIVYLRIKQWTEITETTKQSAIFHLQSRVKIKAI